MIGSKNAGRLSHEMYTTEDYVVCFWTVSSFAGQQERIALEIGVFNNFFPLIVVP